MNIHSQNNQSQKLSNEKVPACKMNGEKVCPRSVSKKCVQEVGLRTTTPVLRHIICCCKLKLIRVMLCFVRPVCATFLYSLNFTCK